jgi:hypothetical protein
MTNEHRSARSAVWTFRIMGPECISFEFGQGMPAALGYIKALLSSLPLFVLRPSFTSYLTQYLTISIEPTHITLIMKFLYSYLFFFLFTISSFAAPTRDQSIEKRDVFVPPVTYPHAGTVWKFGQKHHVTWYVRLSFFS